MSYKNLFLKHNQKIVPIKTIRKDPKLSRTVIVLDNDEADLLIFDDWFKQIINKNIENRYVCENILCQPKGGGTSLIVSYMTEEDIEGFFLVCEYCKVELTRK